MWEKHGRTGHRVHLFFIRTEGSRAGIGGRLLTHSLGSEKEVMRRDSSGEHGSGAQMLASG